MLLSRQKIYNQHFFAIGAKIGCHFINEKLDKSHLADVEKFIQTIKAEVDSISEGFEIYLDPHLLTYNRLLKVEPPQTLRFFADSDLILEQENTLEGLLPQSVIATDVFDYQKLSKLKEQELSLYMGSFIETPAYPKKSDCADLENLKQFLAHLADSHDKESVLLAYFAGNAFLSEMLLNMINEPLFKEANHAHSIEEVLKLFDVSALTKWALMLSICQLTNKPLALIQLALQRALMCQMLAELQGYTETLPCYLTGLTSCFDALLDYPMDAVLAELALEPAIKQAIKERKGMLGALLEEVVCYQQGTPSQNNPAMCQCYMQCSQQTTRALQTIGLAAKKNSLTLES
jgi:EAL and modified HD-GYP domain-containing signal transduction protein